MKFFKFFIYLAGFAVVLAFVGVFTSNDDLEANKVANTNLEQSVQTQKAVLNKEPEPKKKTWSEKWDEASAVNDTRQMANLIMDSGETFDASLLCDKVLRASAKYPNKVKFNWFSGNGTTKLYYTNGTPERQGLYKVIKSGEAMNGFGNMIPFTGICEFSVNINNKTLDLADAYWGSKKVF